MPRTSARSQPLDSSDSGDVQRAFLIHVQLAFLLHQGPAIQYAFGHRGVLAMHRTCIFPLRSPGPPTWSLSVSWLNPCLSPDHSCSPYLSLVKSPWPRSFSRWMARHLHSRLPRSLALSVGWRDLWSFPTSPALTACWRDLYVFPRSPFGL